MVFKAPIRGQPLSHYKLELIAEDTPLGPHSRVPVSHCARFLRSPNLFTILSSPFTAPAMATGTVWLRRPRSATSTSVISSNIARNSWVTVATTRASVIPSLFPGFPPLLWKLCHLPLRRRRRLIRRLALPGVAFTRRVNSP